MEKPHKKLDVWELSMDLATQVYQETRAFPKEEIYGLTAQIRRAAVSIPSNIAEGAGRQTKREFANYLHMAQGSLSELDTLLELAVTVGYLPRERWIILEHRMERVDKMLSGLIRHQKRELRKD
jgi:four helix bundle protein